MATEIRSTRTYWHVQARETVGVARIYPGAYYHNVALEGLLYHPCACILRPFITTKPSLKLLL